MFDILKPAKKRAIDELAKSLADEFVDKYPLALHQGAGNKKTDRKLTGALNSICAKARTFHTENHLDVYGKARLNNTLLWQLRETGYDPEFIDDITKKVIIALSAKSAEQPRAAKGT